MTRRLRLLALLAAMLCVASGLWLSFATSGLGTLARLAESASGGRLVLAGPEGRLVGPFGFRSASWQEPGFSVGVERLRLDWSPLGLLRGRVEVAEASAERVSIDIASSDEEAAPPASLRLPLAVAVGRISVARLDILPAFSAVDLSAAWASEGAEHRLSGLKGRIGQAELAGGATLSADPPLALQARAKLGGSHDGKPLRIALAADGPLARFVVGLAAESGLSGAGEVVVTPFARRPFATLSLALDDVDPADWIAGAPPARLALRTEARPGEAGISGRFSVANSRPGPFDRRALPLEHLAGDFDWQGGRARLSGLLARVGGKGTLAGSGRWQDGQFELDLRAREVDAARLATLLRSTRLDGQISARLARSAQEVALRLADAQFVMALEASHAEGSIRLPRFELAAGDALLTLRGQLDLAGQRMFSADGRFDRFDPRRFARLPTAQINGTLSATGRLLPEPRAEVRFALADSRLAGRPLSGNGDLAIDWPRIPRAEVNLTAGMNRLQASGAFGRPGDVLQLVIDAPQLEPYGLEGALAGRLRLSGTTAQPSLAAEANAARLGVPGFGRLSDAALRAEIGGLDDPLKLTLSAGILGSATDPALVRGLSVQADGTRRRHSLRGSGAIAGNNLLTVAAEGGFTDPAQSLAWSGQLLELRLAAEEKLRSFVLEQPAPLGLGPAAWRIGPLLLAGDPWRLSLRADADAQAMRAELSGRGQRISEVSGRLQASMRDAWTLDRGAQWSGVLRSDIGDLGWVAPLLGGTWQSGGRWQGELTLAGTPDHPSWSGWARGRELAIRLPEQGAQLVDGELEASLADNLLSIERLNFVSPLQKPPRALRLADEEGLRELVGQPGRLEITGRMRVDRDSPGDAASLDFRLDRVGAYQLADQWVVLSGDGRVSWADETLGVKGRLAVDAAYWQLAPMGTPKLSDDVQVRSANGQAGNRGIRPRLDLDLEADLGRRFLFSGAGLETRLAGSLQLRAQGRDLPRAEGRIRMRDGRFDAYGQELEIERGILTFRGLLDNPALDVRAVRTGLPVEAGVQLGGTAQKPVVRLISDPEVPDVEKLSWLVLGHGPEQSGAADATVLLAAAGSLLGNEAGGVVQQIRRGVGIDQLGVRQGEVGDSGGRQMSSRVVGSSFDTQSATGNQVLMLGKRLTGNAMLSYEQALGKAGSVVKLSVALSRQLSLILRAGTDNALDVLYTISLGAPPPREKQHGATK
jgi:translocation and assembly module TamB